jgi:hypothetical protein
MTADEARGRRDAAGYDIWIDDDNMVTRWREITDREL